MTGKDLIVYILQHDLENCKIDEIFDKLFLNELQIAAKFNVGVDTIKAWRTTHTIEFITIRGTIYYYADTQDPRKNTIR